MALTSPFAIELTEAERAALEGLADSRAAPFGQVQRAGVILAVAGGMSNAAAARAAGRHVDTVRAWHRGTSCGSSPPRPRPPPGVDTAWTHRLLADHLRISGLAVSASQVGRILNSIDLKPHLVRGWLTRPADPEFFTKAAAVCALYRRCPPNAVVFSVDEKTGITARSRKHPDQPGRPRQRSRREFEYVRNGTVSIIAALNVHTGQVLTQAIERNNADTFIGFLRTLDTTVPAGTGIHLVMDNGSSHVAKKTKAWLAARPRFQIHHTPKHASWLNQIPVNRAVLLNPHQEAATARRVHLPYRPGRTHRRLRPGLRRTRRQALPLDLRRHPAESRINPRRTNAAVHQPSW